MKKMITTVVAALVAVSFASIVCASEPAPSALPPGHPPIMKEEKAAPKKVKKAKKAKKAKKEMKKEVAPAAAPEAPAAK